MAKNTGAFQPAIEPVLGIGRLWYVLGVVVMAALIVTLAVAFAPEDVQWFEDITNVQMRKLMLEGRVIMMAQFTENSEFAFTERPTEWRMRRLESPQEGVDSFEIASGFTRSPRGMGHLADEWYATMKIDLQDMKVKSARDISVQLVWSKTTYKTFKTRLALALSAAGYAEGGQEVRIPDEHTGWTVVPIEKGAQLYAAVDVIHPDRPDQRDRKILSVVYAYNEDFAGTRADVIELK